MADDMSNLLGTVIIGGMAMKMADSMMGHSHHQESRVSKPVVHRKKKGTKRQNPYSGNKYNPW
jgi:hypothetical protein